MPLTREQAARKRLEARPSVEDEVELLDFINDVLPDHALDVLSPSYSPAHIVQILKCMKRALIEPITITVYDEGEAQPYAVRINDAEHFDKVMDRARHWRLYDKRGFILEFSELVQGAIYTTRPCDSIPPEVRDFAAREAEQLQQLSAERAMADTPAGTGPVTITIYDPHKKPHAFTTTFYSPTEFERFLERAEYSFLFRNGHSPAIDQFDDLVPGAIYSSGTPYYIPTRLEDWGPHSAPQVPPVRVIGAAGPKTIIMYHPTTSPAVYTLTFDNARYFDKFMDRGIPYLFKDGESWATFHFDDLVPGAVYTFEMCSIPEEVATFQEQWHKQQGLEAAIVDHQPAGEATQDHAQDHAQDHVPKVGQAASCWPRSSQPARAALCTSHVFMGGAVSPSSQLARLKATRRGHQGVRMYAHKGNSISRVLLRGTASLRAFLF